MSGDIPCGPRDGFLYPGACSDMCGEPYSCEGDPRTGHECCSTVASIYSDMYEALREAEALVLSDRCFCSGVFVCSRCKVLAMASAALRRARGEEG